MENTTFEPLIVENLEHIKADLLVAVDNLKQVYLEQNNKLPKYIYIYFLRTSILNKLPIVKLYAYNEKGLLDISPLSISLDLKYLSNKLYERYPLNPNSMSIRENRIEVEKENNLKVDIEILFSNLEPYMKEIIEDEVLSEENFTDYYIGFYYGNNSKIGA